MERNERLRYILSELGEDTTHVEDPEWTPEERPLTIMKVEEWEVIDPVHPDDWCQFGDSIRQVKTGIDRDLESVS
ncbi:unnamed protein product [Timema podura]|uniref:Uncharacterized protein n=1 Tax=Timema podura TaxID=61482 RepID=A0ABN7NP95_TIMPD|nr:unnamed protein product [Timema podura]